MIKQVQTDRIKSVVTAASLDQLLADLDAGIEIPPKVLRKAIADARGGIDIPQHYLTPEERANEVIDAVQAAADPLQYARSALNQDFFSNTFLPHEMRRQVAAYLWARFTSFGNPIWKNYLDGTFKPIHIDDAEELDA